MRAFSVLCVFVALNTLSDFPCIGWAQSPAPAKARTLTAPANAINSVVFSKDEKRLLFGGRDKRIHVVEFGNLDKNLIFAECESWIRQLTFDSDGNILVAALSNGQLDIFDSKTGKRRKRFMAHVDGVGAIAFSPDGKFAASAGGDSKVKIWSIPDWTLAAELSGHTSGIAALAFASDAGTLVSGGDRGEMILWDLKKEKEAGRFVGHEGWVHSIAFNPKGNNIASTGDGTVRMWDVATKKLLYAFEGPRFSVLLFTPDGKSIITGGWDKTIRSWNVADRKEEWSLKDHDWPIKALTIDRVGTTLATSGGWYDKAGEVKVWRMLARSP